MSVFLEAISTWLGPCAEVVPRPTSPAMTPHSKRPWLAATIGAASLLAALACNKSTDLKTMTVDDVATRVAAKDGKTFVFDDNPHDRFLAGHVPGALWVAGKEPTAAELPSDKGATLVFYCASEL